MKKSQKPTKLARWLESIKACGPARRRFARYQTFDAAWDSISHSDRRKMYLWWLGRAILRLPSDWNLGRSLEEQKQQIYSRIKARYKAFK